jgi:hypothetical protein
VFRNSLPGGHKQGSKPGSLNTEIPWEKYRLVRIVESKQAAYCRCKEKVALNFPPLEQGPAGKGRWHLLLAFRIGTAAQAKPGAQWFYPHPRAKILSGGTP